MRALVALCLRRPITTLTLHISLLVLGAIAVTRLPINALPQTERPTVTVNIPFPNASPAQVEQEVTRPVEEALATLRGIQELNSESETGNCRVRAEFAWGTNLDLVKLDVRERLARIMNDLPVDDIERIQIRGAWWGADTMIKGRISSKGVDLSENYELLVDKIRRPLERIEGVAQVTMDGVTPLEIHVNFRQEELERHGIDITDIIRRLDDNNIDVTAGEVMQDDRIRRLRVINFFHDIDDVRAFPINEHGLRLEQVATIIEREGEIRFGRHLNGDYAVSLEIQKESTANTVETCDRVLTRLEELGNDPALAGIDVLLWDNQGQTIIDGMTGLRNAGLLGSVLAIIILLIFLRRVSATVLVGMAIPISVLSALGCLYLLDKDLNVITMMALMLGVGMLVDTAVVVVESIVRVTGTGEKPERAAVQGTLEVATPILAATITSIVVFAPIFFGAQSQLNDYLTELGIVIALTLGCSLFVSLTLIPMVSARIYSGRGAANEGWFRRVRVGYESLLDAALRHRYVTLLTTVAILSSAVIPLHPRPSEFFDFDDKFRHNDAVSAYVLPTGSVDYKVMEEYVTEVEDTLRPHHERLGIADVYSWYKDNFSWVAIYPENRSEQTDESLAELRAEVDRVLSQVQIPGVKVRTGERGEFWGHGGRTRDAGSISVRIFGDSSTTLEAEVERVCAYLSSVPGVKSAEPRVNDAVDEFTVRPEEELLSRIGMSSRDLSRRIEAGFGGRFVREIRTPERDVRLRVALAEDETDSVEELVSTPIPVTASAELPLSKVATFEQRKGAGELRRENRQSSSRFTVSLEHGSDFETRTRVQAALERYPWPKGYDFEIGSGWQMRHERNLKQFLLGIFIALFLVYVVMASLFESFLQPLGLMVTVLMAVPGVIWFLYLGGNVFDQPASIGMILLIGIVVNNGIVLVDHVNRYREQGLSVGDAVRRGGSERLRPILITALTTIIGLCPMALGGAKAGGVSYFTLAHTIIGGLAVSTLLTLVVLPVVYSLLTGWKDRSALTPS